MKAVKKTSGQSLVEFALLLPLFLFLVMGLFEIGRAVLYFSVLNNAVREGTRLAIVQPADDYLVGGSNEGNAVTVTCGSAASTANQAICSHIQGMLFNLGELQNNTITIQHFDVAEEYYVRIEITFNFAPITPGLNLIGSFPINVRSQMLKTPLSRP
jgi:hypothetical protein